MTDDEILKVVQAHKDGKKIQCRNNDTSNPTLAWRDCQETNRPAWNFPSVDYREAPTSTLRPWKPEEVPVGALIRGLSYKYITTIFGRTPEGEFWFHDSKRVNAEKAEYFLGIYEHSLDFGKTWLPCGVMEEP